MDPGPLCATTCPARALLLPEGKLEATQARQSCGEQVHISCLLDWELYSDSRGSLRLLRTPCIKNCPTHLWLLGNNL